MNSRRKFIGAMASGLATTLASPRGVLGANERIRLGIIGFGARGAELARQALSFPEVQLTGIADVYTRRLEEAQQLAPAATLQLDYRRLLDDRGIDAVVIATPQHLRMDQFVDALSAGKHVYVEKTMAFTVEAAKQMRNAAAGARMCTVQVGHQCCSSGHVADAQRFLSSGQVGKITAIRMQMYRNTPNGKPQWAKPVFPDMTPETILWEGFDSTRPFDAHRFVNWRYFWDYSGGSVSENLSHQLSFWYKVLRLQIPKAVTMTGGVYLWKDGREVPDTMNVALEQPEQMLVTWDSGFGNNQPGVGEEVLGTAGSILRTQQIRYVPQKVNRPEGVEMLGRTATLSQAHMENFLDCIRSGRETNCTVELGYRVSIACRMAVESYRQGRTVRWDPNREEIV